MGNPVRAIAGLLDEPVIVDVDGIQVPLPAEAGPTTSCGRTGDGLGALESHLDEWCE